MSNIVYEITPLPGSFLTKKGLQAGKTYRLVIDERNRIGIEGEDHISFGPFESLLVRAQLGSLPEDCKTEEGNMMNPRLIEGSSQALGNELIKNQGPPAGDRSNYQAHHILPTNIAEKKEYLLDLIYRGILDVDDIRKDARNGIFLPKTLDGATQSGLPRHAGWHRQYDLEVSRRLDEQYAANLRDGRTDDESMLAMVDYITDQLRDDIQNGRFGDRLR